MFHHTSVEIEIKKGSSDFSSVKVYNGSNMSRYAVTDNTITTSPLEY